MNDPKSSNLEVPDTSRLDTWIGLVLIGAAIAALIEAWTFASVPGMQFGAWTFPVFVSIALGLCGAVLFIKSILGVKNKDDRATRRGIDAEAGIGFGLVIAAPVFYILFSDIAGFLLCSALIVLALSWWFWRGLKRCLALAVMVAPVTELIFAKTFSVPLPKGWLTVVGLF